MTIALKEAPTVAAEGGEIATLPPYVERVLDEVERVEAPRRETPQHPTPAARRIPRPFAFD